MITLIIYISKKVIFETKNRIKAKNHALFDIDSSKDFMLCKHAKILEMFNLLIWKINNTCLLKILSTNPAGNKSRLHAEGLELSIIKNMNYRTYKKKM